jgi:hypothetical protein
MGARLCFSKRARAEEKRFCVPTGITGAHISLSNIANRAFFVAARSLADGVADEPSRHNVKCAAIEKERAEEKMRLKPPALLGLSGIPEARQTLSFIRLGPA